MHKYRLEMLLFGMFAAAAFSGPVLAQCPSNEGDRSVAASPSRPGVTDGADVIQTGVVEVESGWTSAWPGGGARQDSFAPMYKMGVFCNFELRVSANTFQGQTYADGTSVRGMGDVWYSGEYRFLAQTQTLPSLAMNYSVKEPVASVSQGLGSGKVDHIVSLAAGKSMWNMGWNFESKWIVLGREVGSGFDQNAELSFHITRPLVHQLDLIGEVYGDTQRNSATPGFASNLWAMQYKVNPRLIFEGGIDMGITSGAPQKRAFVGMSYAIGDLYAALRH